MVLLKTRALALDSAQASLAPWLFAHALRIRAHRVSNEKTAPEAEAVVSKRGRVPQTNGRLLLYLCSNTPFNFKVSYKECIYNNRQL